MDRITGRVGLLCVLALGVGPILGACSLVSQGSMLDKCREVATGEPPSGGGVVSGTLSGTDGAPIAAGIVFAENRLNGDCVRQAVGSDGHYALPLNAEAYSIFGRDRITYAGVEWLLPMAPVDVDDIAVVHSGSMVTKDLNLVLSCQPSPCVSTGLSLGASVLFANPSGSTLPGSSTAMIVATLQPTGPLVDGSAGETIERSASVVQLVPQAREDTVRLALVAPQPSPEIDGIPLGPYTLSAELVDGTSHTPLVLSVGGGDFAESIAVTFTPQQPSTFQHSGIAQLTVLAKPLTAQST